MFPKELTVSIPEITQTPYGRNSFMFLRRKHPSDRPNTALTILFSCTVLESVQLMKAPYGRFTFVNCQDS